jgi:hypothetical protein
MTEQVKDGGPAFPCSNEQYTHGNPQSGDAWSGLSLRDWFAGRALGAIMESDGIQYMHGDHIKRHAGLAYEYADAMLAAREPTQ